MIYYDDDYKFILMWFIDLGEAVHSVTSAEHDGDKNHTSCECEDHGK